MAGSLMDHRPLLNALEAAMAGNPELSENPRQHAPHGELPAGYHETWFTSGESKYRNAMIAYMHWTHPGDLVFDIGANIGEYTRYLVDLSCRVIAVEPNTEIVSYIDDRATVVRKAVGSQVGYAEMQVCTTNAYLSTLNPLYADMARGMNNAWSYETRRVPVTTLDELISEFGVPAFTKIDVEGYEAEILRGLSTALPAVSFEVQPWDDAKTGECIACLDALGSYDYLYSLGESFLFEPWPPRLKQNVFGDIYATLRP
jgi:FkbM family methyltransferase